MVQCAIVGLELHIIVAPQLVIELIVSNHRNQRRSNRIDRVATRVLGTANLFQIIGICKTIRMECHLLINIPLPCLAHLTITASHDFCLVQGTFGFLWHIVLIILKGLPPLWLTIRIVLDAVGRHGRVVKCSLRIKGTAERSTLDDGQTGHRVNHWVALVNALRIIEVRFVLLYQLLPHLIGRSNHEIGTVLRVDQAQGTEQLIALSEYRVQILHLTVDNTTFYTLLRKEHLVIEVVVV